jgi:hypothetical protein
MPSPRAKAGVAVYNNKIYVIGGKSGDTSYSNAVEEL